MRVINLDTFVNDINHPAPIHFQRRANLWLTLLRKAVREKKIFSFLFDDIAIDYLDVLRGEINIRNGEVLARLSIASQILDRYKDTKIKIEETASENSVSEIAQFLPDGCRIQNGFSMSKRLSKMRSYLYRTRRELELNRKYVSYSSEKLKANSKQRLFVLPRLPVHLKDIHSVVTMLKNEYGVQVLFGVVTEELEELCKQAGFDFVNLIKINKNAATEKQGTAIQQKLNVFLENLTRENFEEKFSDAEITAMKAMLKKVVRNNLLNTLRVFDGAKFVMEKFNPTLYFASNPYTLEGRSAIYVAKHFNIPTASAEHGTIFPDDPIWQECLVDLVCVFGEPSRRALLTCGVSEEQIAVTGAPGFDKIVDSFQGQKIKEANANILVATSGPGDQVSFEQHQRFIRILYQAAAFAPNVRWVVKLHNKDSEEFYAKAAKEFPGASVEIVSGNRVRFGSDIFDFLVSARGLVTVCSTTALDAMLVRVPVIAVSLESKENGLQGVEFLDRDCTLRVETAEKLADAVKMIWQGQRDEKADQSARNYINEHYANLGHATEKVCEKLLGLMKTSLGKINEQ